MKTEQQTSDQTSESPLEEFSITTDQKNKAVKVQNHFLLIAFFKVRDMVHFRKANVAGSFYKQTDTQSDPATKIHNGSSRHQTSNI